MQVGECRDALVFPGGLSECEQTAARAKLATIPSALAQELLDELAARMNAGAIRSTPLSYLRGLIKRAQYGAFTPEAGWRVAQARERQCQNEAIARRSAVAAAHAELPRECNDNDPFVQRVRAIRNKARQRDSSH